MDSRNQAVSDRQDGDRIIEEAEAMFAIHDAEDAFAAHDREDQGVADRPPQTGY